MKTGKDLYAGLAAKLAGVVETDVSPAQRRAAKAAAFPRMFGRALPLPDSYASAAEHQLDPRPIGKHPALAAGYGEPPMPARTATITHVAMGRAVEEEVEMGITHWRCSDGRIVCPEQMSDQHKLNCLRMVARSRLIRARLMAQAICAMQYATSAPDGAADAANEAAIEMMEMSYETRMREAIAVSPVLAKMAAILKERGVDVFGEPRVENAVLADGDPIPQRYLPRPLPGRRRRRDGQAR